MTPLEQIHNEIMTHTCEFQGCGLKWQRETHENKPTEGPRSRRKDNAD